MVTQSFTLPEGYHLMALESSPRTKDGSQHFMAWVRRDPLGEFKGAQGWSADEAVTKALNALREYELRKPQPTSKLQLNLGALRI